MTTIDYYAESSSSIRFYGSALMMMAWYNDEAVCIWKQRRQRNNEIICESEEIMYFNNEIKMYVKIINQHIYVNKCGNIKWKKSISAVNVIIKYNDRGDLPSAIRRLHIIQTRVPGLVYMIIEGICGAARQWMRWNRRKPARPRFLRHLWEEKYYSPATNGRWPKAPAKWPRGRPNTIYEGVARNT